jgi:hypothetical protein
MRSVRAVHNNNISHGVTNLKFRIKANEGRKWWVPGTALPCVLDPWDFETDSDPWIRTLDYGSGSYFFRQWLPRKFLRLFLFESTFTSVFKDKKSLKSHKTVEIDISKKFLLVDWRIRILEAQKLSGPTDQEHWLYPSSAWWHWQAKVAMVGGLKGTVLRDRFRKCWRKLIDLGLNKGRGRFLNFSEAPLIFSWNKTSSFR